MKILLAGATGYIGSRLLPLLLEQGHQVIALVRNEKPLQEHPNLTVISGNLLNESSLEAIPKNIDVVYYLVHSMSDSRKDFSSLEIKSVQNLLNKLTTIKDVRQIIFLSGLIHDKKLSPHLASRKKTEDLIMASGIPYTILRAGIIIGSGSASFEIVRDLVEKLPVMVAPRWVNNLCQPIAVQDVLNYLIKVNNHPKCLNKIFDVGGPEQLTYKNMLLIYAKVRHLKRTIFVVPVLTPRLSSYWLYFVTSVNFSLASSLVDSLKNETICHEEKIKEIFPALCLTYEESIKKALDIMEQNPLLPSWKDSYLSGLLKSRLKELVHVPTFGCLVDERKIISKQSAKAVVDRLWMIGGNRGWYFMNWAWVLRGFFDKLFGGIGLNRGRTHPSHLYTGSSLDFWRVILADKENGRLLLYAEMKLPGEAWLEFNIKPTNDGCELTQTASFRPHGVLGRLYWYGLLPIHKLIFRGMAQAISHPK